MKRIIAAFLSAAISFSAILGTMPVGAAKAEQDTSTMIDNNFSVSGTNSFGNLLSSEFDNEIAQQEENSGYKVLSAEVEGTSVYVSFDTLSDCNLIAAVYDEAGEQLIASGNAKVTADESEKTVTIETEEMPQYFYLRVYLADEQTMRPMCTAYESPEYTQEMQELFAMTVNDFENERVLNLDADETNNFAVYSEEIIIIESDGYANKLTVADEKAESYMIENADAAVTAMQAGDIFVTEQENGDILIVKVGEINTDGTTVMITGADTSMDEVFDYVKINQTGYTADAFVDESQIGEGVTYNGIVEEESSAKEISGQSILASGNKKTIEGETGFEKKLSFGINAEIDVSDNFKVSIKGETELGFDFSVEYYLTLKNYFVEFRTDVSYEQSVGISGTVHDEIELAPIKFSFYGIVINCSPELVVECEGSVEIAIKTEFTIGMQLTKECGLQDISSFPENISEIVTSINVTGSIFIGIDLGPSIEIINSKIAKAGFGAKFGLEFSATGSAEINPNNQANVIHECFACLEGEINKVVELSIEAKLFNMKRLTFVLKLAEIKSKLADFYYSVDNLEFGLFKTCPNKQYKTTVVVVDEDGERVSGATVLFNEDSNEYITDENGKVSRYYHGGTSGYVYAEYGKFGGGNHFTVKNMPRTVFITLKHESQSSGTGSLGSGSFDANAPQNNPVISDLWASGKCGENLTWTLDRNGVFRISGYGEMQTKSSGLSQPTSATIPWYNYSNYIKEIIIDEGITSIGTDAFFKCYSLTKVTIPTSVTKIKSWAFFCCENLSSIAIPDSITSIGEYAFTYCDSLENIYYSGTEEEWNEISKGGDRGYLSFATIHYDSTGSSTVSVFTTNKASTEQNAQLLTADFTGLLPNEVYNFYVMKSRTAENPFSAENLLYISQVVSDGNGDLYIPFIPKEDFYTADIFVAGLTRADISAASIIVPEIVSDGTEQLVNFEVYYDDVLLLPEKDYIIEGDCVISAPGEYTLKISGIGNYTGTAEATFTAECGHSFEEGVCRFCGESEPEIMLGDVDLNGYITAVDAALTLLEYAMIAIGEPSALTIEQIKAADINYSGSIEATDAANILSYYAYSSTGGELSFEEYLKINVS